MLIATSLLAIGAKDSARAVAWVAILPTVAFWWLDAYYLRQERLYRQLYDAVSSAGQESQSVELFCLDASQFKSEVPGLLATLWSLPVLMLHGLVLAAIVGVALSL